MSASPHAYQQPARDAAQFDGDIADGEVISPMRAEGRRCFSRMPVPAYGRASSLVSEVLYRASVMFQAFAAIPPKRSWKMLATPPTKILSGLWRYAEGDSMPMVAAFRIDDVGRRGHSRYIDRLDYRVEMY